MGTGRGTQGITEKERLLETEVWAGPARGPFFAGKANETGN